MRRNDSFWREAKGIFREHIFSFLFLAAILFFLVACSSKKENSSENASKPPKLKIVIAPAEGEIIADLEQPLVLFFPEPVPAADFSFVVEPDPGGWKPIWDAGRKKVRLEHAHTFAPLTEHRVKVAVKGGLSLQSGFKTAATDPSALLEFDLAKGTVTADQAAQYRVMRIFKPGAVPEKYRYAQAPGSGTWDLLQAANQIKNLKPETVKVLEPYLAKPDDPKSIYYKRLFGTGSTPQAKLALVAAAYAAEPVKEVYRTDTGYTIVIYGEPGLNDLVRKARRMVEEYKMYEKYEKLLNRKTIDFGNKTLDIYIFSYLREINDPGTDKFEPMGYCDPIDWDPLSGTDPGTAATWIAVSGRQIKSDLDLAATLAHEMFHSFQFAFSRYEQKWLMEGSAVWAEDFIGHDWNTEQRWLAGFTFDAESANHNQITEKTGFRAYGMYLFFYYLTRVHSGGGEVVMRRIWENCSANRFKTFESVRAALPGDLLETLKEYSLYTLDVEQYKGKFPDTVGSYGGQSPLKLLEDHKLIEKWNIDENGSIDSYVFYLPAMGVTYLKVRNQATGKQAPAIRFDLKEFADKKEIGIQAVIKYRNGRIEKEDWTGLAERIFCLANKTQNFETLYVAVCYAINQDAGDALALDIQPASDVNCVGGQMHITLTVSSQKETERSKHWPGDDRSETKTESWDRQVRFLLQLTPQRQEMTPEVEATIKNVPAEAKEQFLAEYFKPEVRFDQNTRCNEYIFRVKNISLQSLSGNFRETTSNKQNDAFGLVKQCEEKRSENWTSQGLSDETLDRLKKKTMEVRVFIDPKSKQIKWAKLQGPVSAKCTIAKDFMIGCTLRKGQPPDTYFEPYNDSKQENRDFVWKVQEVSASVADLPMNPDWKAKSASETGARGEGQDERSLDDSRAGGDGEKMTTKGKEIKKIEWELQLDLLPGGS